MPIVEESEYKGSPVLVLKVTEDDRFPFQFGLRKAKLILQHLEEVRKFVDKHNQDAPK